MPKSSELNGSRVFGEPLCSKCGSTGPFRVQNGYRRTTCMRCDSRQNNYRNRIRSYGVDGRKYIDFVLAQKGLCALCGEQPDTTGLHIDHDHATHAFRALLCVHCNRGLGGFRDDPILMRKAADYVEHHGAI